MGIEFVTAAQISSIGYKIQCGSSLPFEVVKEQDWGTGFYLLHRGRDAFYSHNDYTRSTSGIVDLVNKLKNNTEEDNKSWSEEITSPDPISIDITEDLPFYHDTVDEIELYLDTISQMVSETQYRWKINALVNFQKKTIQNSEYSRITMNQGGTSIDLSIFNELNGLNFNFGGITKADLNLESVIDKIEKGLKSMKELQKAEKLNPGKYKCLFSADSAYSLIHESIGHAVEADQILSGYSYLSKRIGHKVASSDITITDDPHLRGMGYAEYDDEGTKTKGTLIVEDGILVDFIHTRKTAQLLATVPTGNARISSYHDPPEPRQSNLFIEPKDFKFDELLEEVSNGVFVGPSSIASTSIYSGELQIQTQFGQIIENGELKDYITPLTIYGNSVNLLGKVDAVGSSLEKFPTECLKARSRLYIGAYSPDIVIDEVLIG